MSSRQNILLSSNNKSNITEINNDINLRFPNNLFFKQPRLLELINFDLKYEISLFGDTNNRCIVQIIDDNGITTDYDIIIEFNPPIKTDFELATALKTALNNQTYTDYTIEFDVINTSIEYVITNYELEREDSTNIFTISGTNNFSLLFNIKDAIGPIMGFGNGIYNNTTTIEGTSVPSITTFNSFNSFNETSGNFTYPNYSDVNCKMELFDSNNAIIANIDTNDDMSISINDNTNTIYTSMAEILTVIETEMNRYSASYSPAAVFQLTYDYNTNKVTINNTTGAKFGFSFDFINDGGRISSGGLGKLLGFQTKKYLGITSITSIQDCRVFDQSFAEDYILFCSNMINNNTDINVVGLSNGDSVKSNNILFAIPFSKTSNFTPINSLNYTINIESSALSQGYKEQKFSVDNPIEVNFYLRTLSGRHVSSVATWNTLLTFIF